MCSSTSKFQPEGFVICSRVPFAVEINASFIVDLKRLSSPNDITCDDMGVWKWGGSRKHWILVDEGFCIISKG